MAKDKARKAAPEDRIDVLANVPVSGGPITRVTITKHYSQTYLYLEHASSHILTLVDVSDAAHPAVLANLNMPESEAGSIVTAAGDTVLVASSAQPAAESKTLSIVNFSDPAHAQTVKQFKDVTCTASDERRGLVFVANPEGLWILHRKPAEDPAVQDEYTRQVLYAH